MKIEREKRGCKCEYEVWNEYKTQIIGAATIDESEKPVTLETINIQRNRRDKGIGSKLLQEIIQDYQNKEIKAWIFSARLEWYKRHGFQLDKEKEDLIKVRKPSQ